MSWSKCWIERRRKGSCIPSSDHGVPGSVRLPPVCAHRSCPPLRSARCSVRLSSEGRSYQQTRPQQEDGRTGAAAENNIYELSSEEIKRNKQRSVFHDEVKFFCKIQQGCSWPVIPPPTPPTLTTIRMEELFLYALFKCVFCLFI